MHFFSFSNFNYIPDWLGFEHGVSVTSEVKAGGCEVAIINPGSTVIISLKRIPLKQQYKTVKLLKINFSVLVILFTNLIE